MPSEKDKAIATLLKKVLTWNVHTLTPQKKSLRKVPLTFKDVQDYKDTFEPLLLEECRAQILRSLDTTDESCPAVLVRVRYLGEMDDFFVVGFAFTDESLLEHFHENDLFMLCMEHPQKVFGPASDNEVPGEETDDDTKREIVPEKAQDMQDNPRKYCHLIGSVEGIEQGGVRGKFYLRTKDTDPRIKMMNTEIHYDRDWWMFKLCNLSTLQREYTALYTSGNFPLIQTLATGDCRNDNKDTVNEISEPLLNEFKTMYNDSQMDALNLALSGQKVCLIQGPPGTGKTHVILGIMSVLLHSKAVPKVKKVEIKEYKPSPLTAHDRVSAWEKAQPWLGADYHCVRDDFKLVDKTYELVMERKRREIKLRPNEVEPQKPRYSKRILLCAPSNGAVDEIVLRLMNDGLLNAEGKKYTPSIVRVGPGAHTDVLSVTLDVLARNKLGSASGANPAAAGFHQTAAKNIPLDMNSAKGMVLLEANIVATTLSFSGSSVLSKIPGFDYVIIDEAAQAVETSTLIPLQHQCKGLVLVGDPKQLPATIISKVATDYKYDQSLFERLMASNKSELCLLRTQYRMHPSIRQFPSQHFYSDQLVDAPTVFTGRVQPYHITSCFGPFVFYDIRGSHESESAAGSVCNEVEANFVLGLFQLLTKTYPDMDMQNRVGIISPYRQQVQLLRALFKDFPTVNVDTVDGYQGREKEFIIFSCVRAPREEGAKPSIGFLADVRRMNVGLTRPRSSLLVIGNSKALKTNNDWRAFVNYSVEANSYARIPTPFEPVLPDLIDSEKFANLLTSSATEHTTAAKLSEEKMQKKGKKEGKKKKGEKKGEKEEEKKGEEEEKKGGDEMEKAKEEGKAEEGGKEDKGEEKGKEEEKAEASEKRKRGRPGRKQKEEEKGKEKEEDATPQTENVNTDEAKVGEGEEEGKKYKRLRKKAK